MKPMLRRLKKFALKLQPSIGKFKPSASLKTAAASLPRAARADFFLNCSLIFCALAMAGCQSARKSEPTVTGSIGSAQGQWRGKALVRNWRQGKNAVLDMDILAREPSQLRMEITGSFGVHVASVALNGGEVSYILTQERRFVSAPATGAALSRLVPVRIPPAALLAVMFERDLPEAEWKCDREAATKLPTFCAHKTGDVAVKWLERNGRNRRLKISAKEADIEMVLDEAKSKVEMNSDAFILAPPNGYKKEKLSSG